MESVGGGGNTIFLLLCFSSFRRPNDCVSMMRWEVSSIPTGTEGENEGRMKQSAGGYHMFR